MSTITRKEWPILYKYTQTGAIQQWQIIAEGNKFWTIEGIKDGKLTTSLPTVCKAKNTGKKSATTAEDQAQSEAKSKFQKKLDKGYNETLTMDKAYFEPMLAKDFKESKDIDFKKTRIFVQPKLDGLRSINAFGELTSRNGKPYVACPHLYQTGVTLDGELYNHEFKEDFNKIVSLCKKQKPTEEELAESCEKVQMWVYDFPDVEGTFSVRYEALKAWFEETGADNKGFVLVPTHEVFSEDEIKNWHAKFLSDGYEGTIVRLDNAEYENKRSKQLLKYKDFIDEEFEIVGAVEGEGGRTGTIGKFWMRLEKDKPYIIDENKPVNCFKSNVKGNFDYLRKVWQNKDMYIGKIGTVKYFQRTPKQADGSGNCPRFPFIIKIDREEYE